MSINFGNGMVGSAFGGNFGSTGNSSSVFYQLKQKYDCGDCFARTPQPPAYSMPVMPVPRAVVTQPNIIERFWNKIQGN